MGNVYTGYTKETAERVLLDAGALYVNFNIETDTLETAKAKLLGATAGGNKFEAIPEFRVIKPDGVKGKAKGLSILESWSVMITTNMLEFKEETYKYALAAVNSVDKTIDAKEYTEIKAKNQINDADYIDNITFVGRLSGSKNPIIIQIFNALNMEGLAIENKDGEDIVAEIKFEGHYDAENLESPPFAIYYPKPVVVIP